MIDPRSLQVSVCGVAELGTFRAAGVTHVLSLLDPGTPEPEAFSAFPPHARERLFFHDVIDEFPGYDAPQRRHVEAVLAFGGTLPATAEGSAHVLVHCFMGISRSTAAAAILMAQASAGGEEEAFARLFAVRPRAWPNSRMITLADGLLSRDGALTEALKRHQRRVIAAYPDIPDLVASVGRGHELP